MGNQIKIKSVPERLSALEIHMEYTVKGIDDLKLMMADHVSHPCEKCSLADEVAINANDIIWMKRLGYGIGITTFGGLLTLGVDRFTGLIDKIFKVF